MHAGLLDVLHDAADDRRLAVADSVNVDLNGGVQEVVQQHRTVIGDQYGTAHVLLELFLGVDDLHGAAAQHIGRADHQRVADVPCNEDAFLEAAHRGVGRLLEPQAIDHLLEALAVLGPVDGVGTGANDGHTGRFQTTRQLQRCLAAKLDDDAVRVFGLHDLQNVLQGDRLKIEPVGGVVVGGDRLRVAVDHDGFIAVIAHGQNGMNAAVVELDALADAVGPTADDNDLFPVTDVGLALLLVAGVHVGSGGLEFGGTGIHTLVDRAHAQIVPQLAEALLRHAQQIGQARIREALALEPEDGVVVQIRHAGGLKLLLFLDQILDLDQVPAVDEGVLEHLIHAHAPAESLADVPAAAGARHLELMDQRIPGVLAVLQDRIQAGGAGLEAAQRLLVGLLEGAPNGHDLTHGFHLGGQARVGLRELLKGEPRDLGDHIVDGRLKGGRRHTACDVIAELIQSEADRQLGRHLGDRETGGLGGQRRGARHPGIHLDHHHAPIGRVDAELDVGATGLDTHLAQHRQRGVAHDLPFLVRERLGRRHGNGITGVHAHRIHVLDAAHDDAVVVLVPDNLGLVLFPADERLVDQQLIRGRQRQATLTDLVELFPVVGDAAAGATHGEGGPDDAGQTDVVQHLVGFFHAVRHGRARCLQADVVDRLVEAVAVLGLVDGVRVGTDHLHTMLLEDAVALQVQGAVERGLAAHGGQHGVRLLLLDDLLDGAPGDGLNIGGIGHHRVGHDGRRIGVDQNDPEALLVQGLAGLGAGIVEFARLANHNGAGAKNQNALDVVSFRH